MYLLHLDHKPISNVQGVNGSFDSKAWFLGQKQIALLNQIHGLERHSANGMRDVIISSWNFLSTRWIHQP
jgi:hypothetical protein